ncbi:Tetratricopeptide repeat protein [compost metagenome]
MNSTLFRTLLISIFILLMGSCTVFAQGKDSKARLEFLRLNSLGEKAFKARDYSEAMKNFTKAEFIAEKNNMQEHNLVAKFNIAKIYGSLSNFGESLKYYLKALDIANKDPELREKGLTALFNIGGLYVQEKDYLTALKYYKRIYKEAKEIKSSYNIFISGLNISSISNEFGAYKQARIYLDEIKDIDASKENKLIWHVNYAETFLIEGRVDKAEKIMEEVFSTLDTKDEKTCYLCVLSLLSKIYEERKQFNKAIYYAKTGLENSHTIADNIDWYDMLSNLYFKNKDYNNAFKYKNLLLTAKDSLSESINISLFEANKVRLKIQDYQAETKHHQEKQKAERNLFIIIIILCLSLFVFIYRGLKNRVIKQRHEKIISENNQRIADLEMETLNNNIAEKNRKLSANALYLSSRNVLIEEIIDSLDKIPAIKLNYNAASHIKNLKEHLRTDDDWDDFITYFEQVNPEFLKALQVKHPQLTADDIHFICYMYMNLDVKEISSIFNITVEASKKRKQRIAKKMNIEIEAMHDYILKIGV